MALVLLLGGVAAGCLGAMTGVGGGILLVPLLNGAFGVPFPVAVAASLVGVIATSSGSAARYLAEDLCDVRLGIRLEVATVIGAIAGGLVVTRIPTDGLRVAFGALALYLAGWQFLAARMRREEDAKPMTTGGAFQNLPAGMAVSGIAGLLSALLGIGGGALKVPVMNMVMGVPFRVASATSNYMIGVTASASALLYFRRGQIDLAITAPTVVGVLAGAALGARLMPRVAVPRLRLLFATLLVMIGLQMFWRGLGLGRMLGISG